MAERSYCGLAEPSFPLPKRGGDVVVEESGFRVRVSKGKSHGPVGEDLVSGGGGDVGDGEGGGMEAECGVEWSQE
ncbi:hypothetical protein Acr_23g0014760 [Actinidia rufa]|uniref:Uncharacterized protein n=1 Tax=Actinidia rufa TaxID=165716 RepID=A0A7J0GQN3_9ERIC|nr:hypothetical protein Acr_23g0014760 [Actinidia rufa]